jgi:MinD-like ATPase involved in chromosome partitioning or flagellar assembly
MSEVIAIVSGKGGVGKTTVTANIGTALAAMGYKVLLIDADVGLETWILHLACKTESYIISLI